MTHMQPCTLDDSRHFYSLLHQYLTLNKLSFDSFFQLNPHSHISYQHFTRLITKLIVALDIHSLNIPALFRNLKPNRKEAIDLQLLKTDYLRTTQTERKVNGSVESKVSSRSRWKSSL
jgi:hypothetical protein